MANCKLRPFSLFSPSESIGGQRRPDLGQTPSRDVSSDTQKEAKACSFISLPGYNSFHSCLFLLPHFLQTKGILHLKHIRDIFPLCASRTGMFPPRKTRPRLQDFRLQSWDFLSEPRPCLPIVPGPGSGLHGLPHF